MMHKARAGFSLMELSVVLVIISLIAGAGMVMANGAIKAADRISTQEKLNTIKLALDSHGKTYGYLPCPADRGLTADSTSFGVERRTAPNTACNLASPATAATGTTPDSVGTYALPNNNTYFGAVPVRTLGLPDSYAGDAWGNKFTYTVARGVTTHSEAYSSSAWGAMSVRYKPTGAAYTTTAQRNTLNFTAAANNGSNLARLTMASTGSIVNTMIVQVNGAVYKGSFTVSNRSGTTIDLVGSTYSATDAGTVTWLEPGDSAAYVVVSPGPDKRGGWPMDGTAIPSNKVCNTSATANTSPAPCTNSTANTCIDIANCDELETSPISNQFFDAAYNDSPTTPAQYFDDFIVWGDNNGFRTAANDTLYTSGTTTNCPAGTCEVWCAACTLNYPGGLAVVPPASLTNPILCRKVLTSNAATCAATCFWSGRNANGKGTGNPGYQKCP